MKLLQLAGAALIPLALLACDESPDDWSSADSPAEEVWLSDPGRIQYRSGVVPTPAPGDTAASPRSPFTSVSVGGRICGLREDGSVECGAMAAPDGSFTSVSTGGDHACGRREDGAVVCWGRDHWGQATPPPGTFASVSAGADHTCGVRDDGSVACWGHDGSGQATPPGGRFTSVSAGVNHTCGLRDDGSVACWGDDDHGQSTAPEGAFASVSAGSWHTCGVRADGTIACWGDDENEPDTPPAGVFTSVSIGRHVGCGLREDGTLACWRLAQLFTGSDPGVVPPQGTFTSVSMYGDSACGVREDGSAACWGEYFLPGPAVSITDRTSSSLTVEWLDPLERGFFDSYQVHASRYPEGSYRLVASSSDAGSHIVDGLEPDTAYTVVVLACDEFGCSSKAAVAVTEAAGPVRVPATPTGFRGEKIEIANGPDDARLTWDAVEGATYHELWKGSEPDLPFALLVRISAPLEAQSFDIAPNRRNFGEYSRTSWKVRACNKAGCSAFTDSVTID